MSSASSSDHNFSVLSEFTDKSIRVQAYRRLLNSSPLATCKPVLQASALVKREGGGLEQVLQTQTRSDSKQGRLQWLL